MNLFLIKKCLVFGSSLQESNKLTLISDNDPYRLNDTFPFFFYSNGLTVSFTYWLSLVKQTYLEAHAMEEDATEHYITCRVCYLPFNEDQIKPKLLSCSHTVCLQCLKVFNLIIISFF